MEIIMDSNRNAERLEWFGGNQEALFMVDLMIDIAQTWDDVVDKDKEVTENDINRAFSNALIYLPLNGFYRQIQYQIIPMWITVISSFETANKFERDKDEHGIELAYLLRCSVGQIIAYAMYVCTGSEICKENLPAMWKWLLSGRFEDYRKEHLGE
jgi:hypothetical protein